MMMMVGLVNINGIDRVIDGTQSVDDLENGGRSLSISMIHLSEIFFIEKYSLKIRQIRFIHWNIGNRRLNKSNSTSKECIFHLQFHPKHAIVSVPVAFVDSNDHFHVAVELHEQQLTKRDDEFAGHVIHYLQ